jgi:hypothetical protein
LYILKLMPKRLRVVIRIVAVMAALLLITIGAFWWWYHNRSIPPDTEELLFRGVVYRREFRQIPRPVIIHSVEIDLEEAGARFFVTPGDPARELPLDARTTSQFLKEFKVQVALSGDFIYPWRSNTLLDYYPRVGDPVQVYGRAMSGGVLYADGMQKGYRPTFWFDRNHVPSFAEPEEPLHAVSGDLICVREGKPFIHNPDEPYHTGIHPRAAIGLNFEGTKLYLIAIDGRQPNYSEGVTIRQLGEIAIGYGVHTLLNLDGGGSVALVTQGADGEPRVLNSPIDLKIPGRERAIGNHIGVFAQPRP